MSKEQDRNVVLVSSDGERFEVPLKVASMAKLVKNTLPEDNDDDHDENEVIHCPKLTGPILKKVVEYIMHYCLEEEMQAIGTPLQGETLAENVKPAWYLDYCNVERETLFNLVAAANFMDIKPLLDLSCLAVATLVMGKSVVELRKMFHLPDPAPPANGNEGEGSDDDEDKDDDANEADETMD